MEPITVLFSVRLAVIHVLVVWAMVSHVSAAIIIIIAPLTQQKIAAPAIMDMLISERQHALFVIILVLLVLVQ
jgi:hypothetical protein